MPRPNRVRSSGYLVNNPPLLALTSSKTDPDRSMASHCRSMSPTRRCSACSLNRLGLSSLPS